MTYQHPELSASDTEEAAVDPNDIIVRFLAFSDQSIRQTERLIREGSVLHAKYRGLNAEPPQPLRQLANQQNFSRGK